MQVQRAQPIFISLCLLVLNIFLCTATKNFVENQIPLLNASQKVMASSQSNFKPLSDLLIYPTPASFKHHILPYLPSENVMKLYNHFRSFHPKVDLEKWLEGFITNPVIDFTDSFEKIILFRSPYQFLSLAILYSPKTKLAITVPNLDFIILPDTAICAFLKPPQNIVPFVSKAVSPDQKIFFMDDPKCTRAVRSPQGCFYVDDPKCASVVGNGHERIFKYRTFFVCDEQFLTIAHGNITNYELRENEDRGWYVEYIWEAHNLTGWKKFVVGVRYFVTLPFIKYLQCISPLLDLVYKFWPSFNIRTMIDNFFDAHVSNWCHKGSYFTCLLTHDCIFLFYWYILTAFIFHTMTLPFHTFSFFLEKFIFPKNYLSLLVHCGLHISLCLPYSLFYPKFIDGFLYNATVWAKLESDYVDNTKLNSLNTEPKTKMWSFSFLIPRKRPLEFYICFVLWGIFLSLILKFGFKNWIPCGEYE